MKILTQTGAQVQTLLNTVSTDNLRITAVEEDVNQLEAKLKITDTPYIQLGYIKTNVSTIDGTRTSSTTVSSSFFPVKQGDIVTIYGEGANSNTYKLYAFADSSFAYVSRYSSSGTYRTEPLVVTVPSGVAYMAINFYNYAASTDYAIVSSDVNFKSWETQIYNNYQKRTLDDALLAIRVATSVYSTEDNPSGVRIRIIFPIRVGEKIYCSTTLSSGIGVKIYDTIPNCIYSSATVGLLQAINSGWDTTPITAVARYNGYLVVSLTNGTSAITDERKAEMLAATTVELSYNTGQAVDETAQALELFAGKAVTNPREAWYYIRCATDSSALGDNANGTRLRIIHPVKVGQVLWASTTDANGITSGVWNTPGNAATSGVTGMVEWITSGYIKKPIFHIFDHDGYCAVSLSNGNTAIDDTRKQQMLNSLQLYIGDLGAFEKKVPDIIYKFTQRSDDYALLSGNYYGERPALGKYHATSFGTIKTFTGTVPTNIYTQGMGYSAPFIFWGSEHTSSGYRKLVVLNLETRAILGTLTWSETGEWHMNNINPSTQRYDDADKFPLIYLSECKGSHRCAVVRIADAVTSYTIVQMLTFADAATYFSGSHDWFIDESQGYIYAFGTSITGNTKFKVVKFNLPALTASTVSLSSSDVLDSFDIDDVYIYQGSVVINGRLYIPYGYGTASSRCRMKIVDLTTKQTVTSIPLYQTFGNTEIEGVAPFEDGLLISSGGSESAGILYKLVFD